LFSKAIMANHYGNKINQVLLQPVDFTKCPSTMVVQGSALFFILFAAESTCAQLKYSENGVMALTCTEG
jgi:hypothetical protein